MFRKLTISIALLLAVSLAGVGAASAQCIKKAGEGTSGTKDGAIFQAYEIILQTTDFFGVWAPWITSGGKVGEAPGYRVTGKSSRCRKGGFGYVCIYRATLCKR